MRAPITHATAQGKRDYQEDRYKIDVTNDGILLAVFDGHGGAETSEFCEKNLLGAFNAVADNPSLPFIRDKVWGIFDRLRIRTRENHDGSCVSIVFIPSSLDRAYVGILGDSPVIIKTKDGEYWHSPEHNVNSNPAEVKRLQGLGATVYGGYAYAPNSGFSASGLQLTRSLGDSEFSSILSREPEIFEIPLGLGSFVLVGSDGLFDPSHKSSANASTIVELIEKGATAGNLVNHALSIPTEDNATSILLRITE
jgi:serine/threonine protein phosphatase PrpC